MKKVFLSIVMLMVAIGTKAQLTADGIMALMPDLPTQAEMVRYAKESCAHASQNIEMTQPTLYSDFVEALRAAQEKADEGVDKSILPSLQHRALESRVAGTGRTAREVSHMSEAQREALAQSQVSGTLSSMGLSQAEIAKLQSGKMTQAEAAAIARKMAAARSGGVTMDDARFMQGMTDKERKQFLEMSGLQESLNEQVAADKSKNQKNVGTAKLLQDMARYDRQQIELAQKMQKRLDDAIQAGKDMYNNTYKKQIDQWESVREEAMREGAGSELYQASEKEKIEAAAKKLKNAEYQQWQVRCEFYEKFIPMWRNAITDIMDIKRSQELPLMQEKKIATDKLYKMTKDAKYAMGAAYPIGTALEYLGIPEDIGEYDKYLFSEE